MQMYYVSKKKEKKKTLAHRDHIILDQPVALDSLTVFKASRAEDHMRNEETPFTTMMLDAQTQSRWMDVGFPDITTFDVKMPSMLSLLFRSRMLLMYICSAA